MLAVYFCIHDHHDLRLVALAGLICVLSAVAIVLFLRRAGDVAGKQPGRWTIASGTVGGFGIWATHFVAMMGYDPGIGLRYALFPTVLSLFLAAAALTIGFSLAIQSRTRASRVVAGVIMGLGIAAMHYLGMEAIEIGADFHWQAGMVVASIVLGIVPAPFAITLAIDRRGPVSVALAAGAIALGVLAVHFCGMAGLTLVPHRSDGAAFDTAGDLLLSSPQMAVTVAVVAIGVLATSMIAVISSMHLRQAVAASEREFKLLVEGINDCAIYMLGPDGRVTSWNAGAERLMGYTRSEALKLDLTAFHSLEDRAVGTPLHRLDTARSAGKFEAEGWCYRKDASRFWAHVTIEAVHDGEGALRGFAQITRDMTRARADQEQLEATTSKLDAALSNMRQGLCMFDADERLTLANERFGALLNLDPADYAIGTTLAQFVRVCALRNPGLAPEGSSFETNLAGYRAQMAQAGGGTHVWEISQTHALAISHGPMADGGCVTTIEDITELRRVERHIEHMALHDELTGLPNRLRFTRLLDATLVQAAEAGEEVAVIGIDLDRFKEVNDLHGHSTGDEMLRLVAARMQDALLGGECVARFGGDEFAAFKPVTDRAAIADFVARLEDALTVSLAIDGVSIRLGASLGVAVFPVDGTSREHIQNNADLAMYRAKGTVGRQVCYYEQGMDEAARARRTIANDLREAIARDELSLAFQVQKSVSTEQVIGYEALLRWNHPRDGWISPTEFIPIAEESGEILRIGEWVLRQACISAAGWAEPWRVAVNLSPIQLNHVDFVQTVTNALLVSGLSPKRLELEITETAFIADKVRALHVLRQVKALGVSIAIDDFGTGYSSLDTLNSFPFDKIKIDRSFLMDSETSHQARAIIRAVLALGRSLDVPVLAEGLESEDQLRLLRTEGCDEAQGYLWGRPIRLPVNGVSDNGHADTGHADDVAPIRSAQR